MRLLVALLGALLGLSGAAGAKAAALDAAAQQRIRAATFEVVQRKPEESTAITYDRPLPLELIPYQERTDQYRSVGTAFAIGPNRYVTAAHVLALGAGSQFGTPALRDAGGTVYEIDQVWKYSDHEDFAVFSLRAEPRAVQVLVAGGAPAPNDAVFAVGNALGEGVVIRDGVYTSETPEELNGEWKWLRFSAAASPGNSGGPLVDQAGQVIGVVLRKSESENLNYALPIKRVIAAREGEGRIDDRTPIRLPIMDVADTLNVHERLALPSTLAQLYPSLQRIVVDQIEKAQSKLLDDNRQRLFPDSASSRQVLHSHYNAYFPRLIRENSDGVWALAGNEKPQSFQLDHNGYVETAQGMVRLRLPDDIALGTLYADSKLYMDLLLKGYEVRRSVGSDSVKVTSLGKAQWQSSYTDDYGRTWQLLAWAEPWSDTVLVAMSLPTPQGYVGFLVPVTTGFRDLLVYTQQLMANFVEVAIGGTLSQWHDFLAQKGVGPKVLATLELGVDPAQGVRFRSARCQLELTPELLPLSKDSDLWLYFGFFRDGARIVWDIDGVGVQESGQKHNWVEFRRNSQPDADLPQGFQSHWSKVQAREFPFNGNVSNSNGSTRISTTAQPPAGSGNDAKVRYVLTLISEGDQPQDAMRGRLELLRRSFTALE